MFKVLVWGTAHKLGTFHWLPKNATTLHRNYQHQTVIVGKGARVRAINKRALTTAWGKQNGERGKDK